MKITEVGPYGCGLHRILKICGKMTEKFDVHGFLISDEEDVDRCHGCYCTDAIDGEEAGIEDCSKGVLWKTLLCAETTKQKNKEVFDYEKAAKDLDTQLESYGWNQEQGLVSLVTFIDAKLAEYENEDVPKELKAMRQILMDVDRTFPNHKMFLTGSHNQFKLFRILVLYNSFNQAIGYCQGMAYVMALLQMYIHCEEDTFWCFSYLLDNHCHLFYEKSLKRIKVFAEVVRTVLSETFPSLASFLDSLGIHPLMYTTQWFMSLFTGLHCWDTVLFIAELIFREGMHHFLNAAMVILEACMEKILKMSRLDEVLPFLQNIPAILIHRSDLEPLMMTKQRFRNMDQLAKYVTQAEQKVEEEEKEMEAVKMEYIQKSSRKRQRDEGTVNHSSTYSRSSVIKPSKKTRVENVEPVKQNHVYQLPLKKKNFQATPVTRPKIKSTVKTSTIKKSALDSVKKGYAELCYTKETGLIYTSPNTVEMRDMNAGRHPSEQASPKTKTDDNKSIAQKLTFDSIHDNKSPLVRK